MALLSGVGLVLTLVFGCLLLALVAELYYLLWWKKQRITSCNSNTNSNSNNNSIELDYSNHTKEMFYLFCWDKPTTTRTTTHQNSTLEDPNPISNRHDPDLETGLGGNTKEESVEAELMRLHNLVGPPRFLFTIKEESKEDLESNIDAKSRTTSLSDFIVALDSQTPFLSPMNSPNFLGPNNNINNINNDNNSNNNYNNPLFESTMEAELFRLRSSPPPKFKFLRDAEEKLYRRLLEEAHRSGKLHEGILDISHPMADPREG
ncbi:hypothetical protein RND81_01G009900 [Saponaria officinalis]|uniref:Uncharacterized protein n=1 Tax=Saponaria officinalis TaxID=3572 RepID=A0AAW1NBR5_SAPOF